MKEREAIVRGWGQNKRLLVLPLALSVMFAWSAHIFSGAANSQPVPLPSGGSSDAVESMAEADTSHEKLSDGAVKVPA
jgi:hypothetical protein